MSEQWQVRSSGGIYTVQAFNEGSAFTVAGRIARENDANLIAAAPDMLHALQEAQLQIEYLHSKFQATGTGEAVLARIKATIAKAEST